jgi:hypothetical protein
MSRKQVGSTRTFHHFVLISIASLATLLLWSTATSANDPAADIQKAGNHATIHTPDGGIRDDEFVDFVCQKINENGGKVKDVKIMVNSCYGGGILDDFQRAFGPGGACEGTPWVGGSASAHDETAIGWSDSWVSANPDQNIGSAWTDALAGFRNTSGNADGVITKGSSTNNVLQDLIKAGATDRAGPGLKKQETPQAASGNGGHQIMWNMAGAKHEAIVFGGEQTNLRHHNNIENVTDALNTVWGSSPHNIQSIDGGNKEDLLSAIEAAAKRLDENTQLVIYIDDHGGSRFDFDEAIGGVLSILIEDEETFDADLPPGLFQGLWGNFLALEDPHPSLDLDIMQCNNCSNWAYHWNGYELDFPSGNPTGMVRLMLPFYKIFPGMNYLDVVPRDSSSSKAVKNGKQSHFGTLELSNLEFNTGGVNELESDHVLVPAQTAAYFDPNRNGEGIFVELLDNGKALVYVFTYAPDGGQAWMLGLGDPFAFGIVIKQMFLPTGASFGPDFDPDDVVMNPLGGLAFGLPSCGTTDFAGILNITPNAAQGYEEPFLDTNYQQLAEIIDCQTGEKSVNSGYSGSWYDPTHSGEGIILEILQNETVIVQWFTFDEAGGQMWIQGTGTISGKILTVDNLFTTEGTSYGTGFNPDDVVKTPWGTLTMEFNSCGEAVVKYDSSTGFGSGTLNMSRLTNLLGIPCA